MISAAAVSSGKCSRVIGNAQNAEQKLPNFLLNQSLREWINCCAGTATGKE